MKKQRGITWKRLIAIGLFVMLLGGSLNAQLIKVDQVDLPKESKEEINKRFIDGKINVLVNSIFMDFTSTPVQWIGPWYGKGEIFDTLGYNHYVFDKDNFIMEVPAHCTLSSPNANYRLDKLELRTDKQVITMESECMTYDAKSDCYIMDLRERTDFRKGCIYTLAVTYNCGDLNYEEEEAKEAPTQEIKLAKNIYLKKADGSYQLVSTEEIKGSNVKETKVNIAIDQTKHLDKVELQYDKGSEYLSRHIELIWPQYYLEGTHIILSADYRTCTLLPDTHIVPIAINVYYS